MMRVAALASVFAAVLLFAACSRDDAPPEPIVPPQPVVAAEPAIDPVTGLVMTGDWEIVRANCVACHSARLITQQRGSAQQWLTMIRWMQKKQNLWQFDPATEEFQTTHSRPIALSVRDAELIGAADVQRDEPSQRVGRLRRLVWFFPECGVVRRVAVHRDIGYRVMQF